jgi:GT2 family glycosyltransferase
MRVTVCIGSVQASTIGHAIESLAHQTTDDFDVVLVGQGDDPGIRAFGARLEEDHPQWRYVHLAERGVSRARNAAVDATTSDVVAFIDDDCEASPNWVETMLDSFTKDPSLGVIGGAVLRPDRELSRLCTCPSFTPAEMVYDPVASGRQLPAGFGWMGCNFAVRRDLFLQVGSFDPALGPGTRYPAAEDTDLGFRLERAGIRMRSTPDLVVTHTYGVRCGVRTRFAHSRNYARGNGALAGKLTLAGDVRGDEWRIHARSEITAELRRLRVHTALAGILRYRHFGDAYRSCMRDYDIDETLTVLRPKH